MAANFDIILHTCKDYVQNVRGCMHSVLENVFGVGLVLVIKYGFLKIASWNYDEYLFWIIKKGSILNNCSQP